MKADLTTEATAVSNNTIYTVYGGSAPGSPDHGWIWVSTGVVDPCSGASAATGGGDFSAPTNYGAITITGISGTTATFQTANGISGTFNAQTGKYGR
jgi:hypothetical protein